MTDRELAGCADCGMPCTVGEYHPFAACLMFKACKNSETVRSNLAAVLDHGSRAPSRDAVRYRWLRENEMGVPLTVVATKTPYDFVEHEMSGEHLDRAIDAAIAAAEG